MIKPAEEAAKAVRPRGLWFLWSLPLLPQLYVLGIGPALWALPQPAFRTLCLPLMKLEEHCRPLDRFITWYMEHIWNVRMW